MISTSRGWRAAGGRQLPAPSPWLSVEGIASSLRWRSMWRVVLEPAGDDMDHAVFRILLDDAVHRHQPRAHDDLALLVEHVGPDDEVGDPGLVLERDEAHALGAARPLADQHQPGDRHALAVADDLQLVGGDEALRAHNARAGSASDAPSG